MTVDRSSEPIAELLRELRLTTTHYCRTELSAPWGLEMTACELVVFHFVAAGRCWLSGSGGDRWLDVGDLVVFPRGDLHRISDRPGRRAETITDLPKSRLGKHSTVLRTGGGGEPTLLLCGGTGFDPPDQPLVAQLPDVLVLRSKSAGAIADAMAQEAADPSLGAETVISRLADVLIVQAVRTWLRTDPHASTGYLGALRDRHLGPVLAGMHHDPGRPWTVASLAATANLSRSTFAERFTATVGQSPMAYLTGVRMRLATSLMAEAGLSPSQAARRVGYDSLAAFSRAYKRVTGRLPGAVRRG